MARVKYYNRNTKQWDYADMATGGGSGEAGKDGADGKSAYRYAVEGGYTGTEEEFAEKLAKEIPTKTSDLTNDSGFITPAAVTVKSVNGKTGAVVLSASDVGARASDWMPTADNVGAVPVARKVNGKALSSDITLSASDVGARPSTWTPTYTDVGADKSGSASTAVTGHNTHTSAHNDIRLLITELTTRLDALANSDDDTLDQMAEVVAYIKDNRELIEQITTNKVSVSDIVNNLTTNVSNKPLSAAQGVALKALIDAITVPTKVSELTNDAGYLKSYTETDPTVPSWAKASSKPSYTKSEVGLANVDNVKQYSASNPPPYPVTSVNGKTGAVTVDVPSVPSWAMATSKPSYTASEVGAVPTSRTVNGKALSANISLSASDVGARASTWKPNAAQIAESLGYTPASLETIITITGKDADGNTHTFKVVGWEADANDPS